MQKDHGTGEVTQLLRAIKQSEPDAESRLYEVVYTELRRIAAGRLRPERPDHTLTPTALVHEAWLRLTGAEQGFENRSHFLAVAAQAMRRVLVDYARTRNAEFRGRGQKPVALDNLLNVHSPSPDKTILDLDEALLRLEGMSQRAARVIEMRFFGGLTESEVAEVLGVTRRTVNRDWEMARAWLYGQLDRNAQAGKDKAQAT
jgi:RNA polymerase sigma factor (TIGR02999 family)